MKCLLILASLMMLAASSPLHMGYEVDDGWQGVGQPGVHIPSMPWRGQVQPGVFIPHAHRRTISRWHPVLTAETIPGVDLFDHYAVMRNALNLDMEARGRWKKILTKIGKDLGKGAAQAAGQLAVNAIANKIMNPNPNPQPQS